MMSGSRNRTIRPNGVPTDETHMENLNESMTENLSSKVGQLKSLAIDLETETQDQMPLLDGFEESFDNGLGRLGGTFNRLRGMGRGHWTSGRKFVFTVAGFTFGILFLMYLVSRYR